MPPSSVSAIATKASQSRSPEPLRSTASPQHLQHDQEKPAKRPRLSSPLADPLTLSDYRLPFADADVYYVPSLIEDETLKRDWYEQVLKFDGWYRPTLKMYGREITQSRKIAAFATDPTLTVKYSGHPVKMVYEYPPLLREIQDIVERATGTKFNHCMLNYYEDGDVYIGKHRDLLQNKVIASLSLGAERTFVMTHDAPPGTEAAAKRAAKAEKAASKAKAKVEVGSKRKTRKTPAVEVDTSLSSSKTDENGETETEATGSGDGELIYAHRWLLAGGSLVVMQGDTQKNWKHEIPKEKKVKQGRVSLTFRQLEG